MNKQVEREYKLAIERAQKRATEREKGIEFGFEMLLPFDKTLHTVVREADLTRGLRFTRQRHRITQSGVFRIYIHVDLDPGITDISSTHDFITETFGFIMAAVADDHRNTYACTCAVITFLFPDTPLCAALHHREVRDKLWNAQEMANMYRGPVGRNEVPWELFGVVISVGDMAYTSLFIPTWTPGQDADGQIEERVSLRLDEFEEERTVWEVDEDDASSGISEPPGVDSGDEDGEDGGDGELESDSNADSNADSEEDESDDSDDSEDSEEERREWLSRYLIS